MIAVVLAAGYAVRLYPLTENQPKCLLKVGNQTILDRLCEKLMRVPSITKIVVVTNAKFYGALTAWREGLRLKIPVEVLNDGTTSNGTRLGAIGDFRFALEKASIQDSVLLLASDNLFSEEMTPFVEFAEKTGGISIAAYDIKDKSLAAGKYGVIEFGKDGRVSRIEEKPAKPKTAFIGMGVYYFPKKSLTFVSDYLTGSEAQDAPGHYVRWLLEKTQIFCFVFKGMWYDIGDFRSLEEAGQAYKNK